MGTRTWRVAWVASLASAAVLMAACGSDGDGAPDSATTEAAAPTSTIAAEPTTGAETAAADVPTIAVDDRLGARLEVGGQPDWLAVAGDALWAKTDSGHVVRVDPETTTAAPSVEVGDPRCQGLGGGDGELWACADEDGGIVRLDPATGEVLATVDAGKINAQGQIVVAFGHAWVLVGDGSRLVGIADDAVAVTIELGTVCVELTASATAIWAACPTEGMAVKVDPVAGEVVARVPDLPAAWPIAAGDGVWVGFESGLAHIDDASAKLVAVADGVVGDATTGLAVAPDAVWVHAPGRFLRRIDPATATVVEEITAPEQSGGGVLVAFGSVWAVASDDNVLYRLDPD